MPQTMIELNRRIFIGVDDTGDFTVNLDDWIFKEGEMVRYENIIWESKNKSYILVAQDVFKFILLKRKEEEVSL